MKRQFAEQYRNLEQWHWWFRGRQRILETVLRRELREKSTLRIVSVGCGPAEGLAWLARLTDSQGWIVGLDSDPLHARRLNSGLEYVVGKLEAVPFASRTFDVVLVTSGQKNNHNWEGGHKVGIEVADQKIAGTVNNDGEENDPVKPYWNYVISKLGRVTIEKAGAYQLSLKPDSIVSEQKLGLTLVEVKLVPVQK